MNAASFSVSQAGIIAKYQGYAAIEVTHAALSSPSRFSSQVLPFHCSPSSVDHLKNLTSSCSQFLTKSRFLSHIMSTVNDRRPYHSMDGSVLLALRFLLADWSRKFFLSFTSRSSEIGVVRREVTKNEQRPPFPLPKSLLEEGHACSDVHKRRNPLHHPISGLADSVISLS